MIKSTSRLANNLGPYAVLLAVYGIACFSVPTFMSVQNSELILIQTAIVACLALGMTVTIISSGIDLSVGSVVAVTTVTIATLLNAHVDPWGAVLIAVLLGGAWGTVNGLLVTKVRGQAFMSTLIVFLAARAVANAIAHEQKVDAPVTGLNMLLTSLPESQRWQLLPAGVWLVIGLSLLVYAVLRFTAFGRSVFYLGSNEQAARLCGLSIDKLKIAIYALSGLFAAIAGVLQFSRLTVGDPTVGVGLELTAIAAVVIGGGSLSGGRGSVQGTIAGALLMTVIKAWCIQKGYESYAQQLLTAAVLVAALMFERMRAGTK
jgi:ribose/xylose/arabinose/galactoside ABC-type transport system permease subunit